MSQTVGRSVLLLLLFLLLLGEVEHNSPNTKFVRRIFVHGQLLSDWGGGLHGQQQINVIFCDVADKTVCRMLLCTTVARTDDAFVRMETKWRRRRRPYRWCCRCCCCGRSASMLISNYANNPQRIRAPDRDAQRDRRWPGGEWSINLLSIHKHQSVVHSLNEKRFAARTKIRCVRLAVTTARRRGAGG